MTTYSRRNLLKLISSAPLFPLASSSPIALLAGIKSADAASTQLIFESASFISMPAPSLSQLSLMAKTEISSALEISYKNGPKKVFQLAYEPFFITGNMVPTGNGSQTLAGGYYNIKNQPILDQSVLGKERQIFSDCPDGTSLLKLPSAQIKGVKGNPVFAVVQFEYASANQKGDRTYGTLPSAIAVLSLDQDKKTGNLSLVQYRNVDTSAVKGLWISCGSSLSPWNTHLSSEEYEPDAAFISGNKRFKEFSKNLFGDEFAANPYDYGHLPEITVNPDGSGSIMKHYCMGRISHELVVVMPDNRTVLMGDDYVNSGLFVFIADRPTDLSSGTLYVAKLGEGFSINPGDAGAKLSWIKLGHATSSDIRYLAHSLQASDIMTVLKTDPNDASFTKIFYDGAPNWIKLKPGMEKAAAFLETHRYAYLMGGSMGFSKMEGTTVNLKDKIAYTALQNIQDSMIKTGKGWNAGGGIALDEALMAGGIFAHKLSGGQKDQTGATILSEWLPYQMYPLLKGEDITPDALGNLANPDKISNPDNLKYSEKLRTLFIGEDSSTHVNNFIWAYNVDTKKLSRIMSMPAGAEATGLEVVDNLNGWTYITTNFQHAGDWQPKLHGKVKTLLDPLIKENYKGGYGAAVGYITAKPVGIKIG